MSFGVCVTFGSVWILFACVGAFCVGLGIWWFAMWIFAGCGIDSGGLLWVCCFGLCDGVLCWMVGDGCWVGCLVIYVVFDCPDGLFCDLMILCL